MADAERLSRLEFRPWPHADPVPWPYLIDILDKRQILEIAKVQVQLHEDMLRAQLKAVDAVQKAIGVGR
ncbi:MAG: hypothetical protein JNK30_14685 [Phenylobacterium sp.]|uniref:hypothetical protein n=1 Tax=Phenylobacterium sp. TaxID=1871053 RepID=UPI001A3F8166|nr:hypothetical protein [Phenylobacterium sp.]MBL8772626.1 hypothetical protein [Phenylobacterium sp.]